jgi:hypothetical protein
VDITIIGDTAERKIILNANGALFTVNTGVTLILDDKITLVGRNNNTASLVMVNSGGILDMKNGAKISENALSFSNSTYGGGIYVAIGGTFTMSGGEISGNAANSGGGIYTSGTLTMSGGEISGNAAVGGGGIFTSGISTMSGGKINGNTASYAGGGVYIYNGTFVKTSIGGIIYGDTKTTHTIGSDENTAAQGGHAVYVRINGQFIFSSPFIAIRNSTAGSSVAIDSRVSGSAGGWE